MKKLISCTFNMDNACVELKFSDGSMIAIDTIDVENKVAANMYQRSEVDWPIYNKPLEYAQLVLDGDLEQYVQGMSEHRLMDIKTVFINFVHAITMRFYRQSFRCKFSFFISIFTDDNSHFHFAHIIYQIF